MAQEFEFQPLFETKTDSTLYRSLELAAPTVESFKGKDFLIVPPETLSQLCEVAFDDVSHLLRTSHLEKLALILKDPEASSNDRFVATELLKNAVIAAERIFPSCQDTGTALVMGKKGESVLTGANDIEVLSRGIFSIYKKRNLRYSQLAPISMFEEKNT